MSYTSTTVEFRTYLWLVSLVSVLLLSVMVSLNYVLDPYLIHQWDTPLVHRLAPKQQKISPWAKTYAVSRYKPDIVYLGSSRTEIGLPPQIDLFAGKRVFNLAIRGGSLGDSIAMLKHTSVFNRPSIVVWGLDYGGLFNVGSGNSDFDSNLVAEGRYYSLWRTLINIKRSISMDVTQETLKQLMGLSEQTCESVLAVYGQRSGVCVKHVMVDEGGTIKHFERLLKKLPSTGEDRQYDSALQRLETVIHEHCQHGTVFRFYTQPIHALDELYHDTVWQHMENWKRDLVKVMDVHKKAGCDIRLMDFANFNSITTEEIPQVTGKETMQNYWEASHYRSEIGEKVLKQLFSTAPQTLESDFGVELNGATIEAHLNKTRQNRDNYCQTHPKETALLKKSCASN